MPTPSTPLPAVHLTGGEDLAWAIDEDLRLLRGALEGSVRFTPLARARIVHSVWWHQLVRIRPDHLAGRHVLCYADNAPLHYITQPGFVRARPVVDTWIGRSTEAIRQFAALGIRAEFAPYTVDTALFRPLPDDDPALRAARERWAIPSDAFLVANFHRDTDGKNLARPKEQKGPELFVEILRRLRTEGIPAHALLAGPRRHWIRSALTAAGVPYTFAGTPIDDRDDMRENVLSRSELNVLYNLGGAYLVTSRWEGGPHSILEAAAAGCRVASTRVGIAEDVLHDDCLFDSVEHGVELLRKEAREGTLAARVESQRTTAATAHSEAALREHLQRIYSGIPERAPAGPRSPFPALREAPLVYAWDRLCRRIAPPRVVLLIHPAHATTLRPILEAAMHRAGMRTVPTPAEASMALVVSDGDQLPDGVDALPASVRRRIHLVLGTPTGGGAAFEQLAGWNRSAWTTVLPSLTDVFQAVGSGRPWAHPLVVPDGGSTPGSAARIASLFIT
jgi:glycosyltransferase involved in cell wall biosynthesis